MQLFEDNEDESNSVDKSGSDNTAEGGEYSNIINNTEGMAGSKVLNNADSVVNCRGANNNESTVNSKFRRNRIVYRILVPKEILIREAVLMSRIQILKIKDHMLMGRYYQR